VRVRDLMSFLVFGLMIAFSVGYAALLGIRVGLPSNRADLSMTVTDVNSLVVGSNVLLRGVPVGKVDKITSSIEGAAIDFYVDGAFHVPVDTDVRLENLSALGETYIELIPRTQGGPWLHDGQSIATESIKQPPSISELATSVVRVLNQLDPDALDRIISEADAGLPDPNTVLPNLSRTAELLRNTTSDMNGRGQALLDNFQTLLRNAGWLGPAVANLTPQLRQMGKGIQQVDSGLAMLVYNGGPQTLYKFDSFLARIQKLLDNNGGDLKVLGDALRPHMQGISGALMNFDTGQILTNLMNELPEDGAITLHVSVPGN
jgi:phospholipid/cholesterol/gamma-HCH transport system substrate-binding protein